MDSLISKGDLVRILQGPYKDQVFEVVWVWASGSIDVKTNNGDFMIFPVASLDYCVELVFKA